MSEATRPPRCRCGRPVIQRENWWPYGPKGCQKCLKLPHLCDCPPFLESFGYIDPLERDEPSPSYGHKVIMPPAGLCDFCLKREITKEYPAQDSRTGMMGVDIHSTGAWAACSSCAPLIDAGDWDGLLRRVVQESLGRGLPPDAAAAGALISLKVFRNTRR